MNPSHKLLIATNNPGKLRELQSLVTELPFQLVGLADVGISERVAETGITLEENASLKATTYADLSGIVTLADDSGLEVKALGGKPGVFSARYAGPGATDTQRIAYLLRKLDGIPERKWGARFRCVIAVACPDKVPTLYAGKCSGRIVKQARGSNGFGYDPVFLLPELGRTMAELSLEEKNRISHRSVAARKALAALNQT